MADEDELLKLVIRELLVVLDDAFLGPRGSIYCYRTLEDIIPPSREFLDALAREPRASYGKQFQRHCQGHTLRGDKHHVWKGRDYEGLAEYKDIQSKTRLVHTTEQGNLHILLFGFTGKKENKTEARHQSYAVRLRDEFRDRRDAIKQRLERRK